MDGARVLRVEMDKNEDGVIERWESYDARQALEKVEPRHGPTGKSRAQSSTTAAPWRAPKRISTATAPWTGGRPMRTASCAAWPSTPKGPVARRVASSTAATDSSFKSRRAGTWLPALGSAETGLELGGLAVYSRGGPMKFKRLVVLVTSVAFVAGVQPGVHAGLLAASRAPVSGAQGPSVTPHPPALGISGTVLGFDRISQVPNQRVQLRSVDKGTIVGKTVTDGSGAFSFAVTSPASTSSRPSVTTAVSWPSAIP